MTRAIGQFEAGLNLPASPIPVRRPAIGCRRTAPGDSARGRTGRSLSRARQDVGRRRSRRAANCRGISKRHSTASRLRPRRTIASAWFSYRPATMKRRSQAFREAIRLRPDFADAHQNLGAVLTASDPAEAVRELERAAVLEPRLLKAQYNLALAYEASPAHGPAQGDRPAAQSACRREQISTRGVRAWTRAVAPGRRCRGDPALADRRRPGTGIRRSALSARAGALPGRPKRRGRGRGEEGPRTDRRQ